MENHTKVGNLPTAEEFARREYQDDRHIDEFAERQIDMKHALWMMQTFAQLHVEAALKAASKKATTITKKVLNGAGDAYENVEVIDINTILTVYPKENIK